MNPNPVNHEILAFKQGQSPEITGNSKTAERKHYKYPQLPPTPLHSPAIFSVLDTMARSSPVMESVQLMNAAQICRESIRILLVHPTHFQSISIFFFSPLAVSLFISHFIIHQSPRIPESTLRFGTYFFGENGALPLRVLSKSVFSFIICFPASITFSLLGKAATIQAVAESYCGVNFTRRRLLTRGGGGIWVKLLYTYFWKHLIIFSLFWCFITGLALVPRILLTYNICSSYFAFWAVLGLLGLAFCICIAHVMVVGDLAWVLTVLEGDCCGLNSFFRAKKLLTGRRHTALLVALASKVGLRLVEGLYEFRMSKGMSLWEGPMIVSMYSIVLVLDTVMSVVFYYTGKQRMFLD